MGTKNSPGKFDCYSRAEPDEPYFVLLGRDPMAPLLIRLWTDMRHRTGEDMEKVLEAKSCANACQHWLLKHEKTPADARIQVARALLDAARKSIVAVYDESPESVDHLFDNAVDGLSSAAGYLETIERELEEKREP